MSFQSTFADRIWEDLYAVYAPDFVTMNSDYIRKFGVPSSGNKDVDKMMASNLSYVRIPIIRILEYFENGVEVQIPSRVDMIAIHKAIENYLSEWREHIKYDINLDRGKHKSLLLGLEKLSKRIFDKAYPREVLDEILKPQSFGLPSILSRRNEDSIEPKKPDYQGIGSLLNPKSGNNRF